MRYVDGLPAFGAYVHVPFCRRRCGYCAFATWSDRHHLWEQYVKACRSEVKRLADQGVGPVSSVYFGGGTPSLLPAEMLLGVLDDLAESAGLAPAAEVTVECNPDTVTPELLRSYRAGGVTRLSFGVQSMVPHVLASLGREHGPASVERAAQWAGEAGFAGSYSVDLIFGAAGETLADWEASIVGVLALGPPPAHVSAYALSVEPGTPLARRPELYPDDDDQARKYALADALLGEAGFQWYEISNWCKPGAECAHNLLYWSQGEYVGIGCSAHSHRVLDDGGARRWWNVATPELYCERAETGRPAEAAGETLGSAEREWEALMLGLRTRAGVPASALPADVHEQGLVELHRRPVAGSAVGEQRAVLTLRGRLLANEVSLMLQTPLRAQ
ncbi:MAG: radical SAM family heme chaperone HemW [Acidimicrobiales bacterium]